jgi:hypothetical protein
LNIPTFPGPNNAQVPLGAPNPPQHHIGIGVHP